MVLPPEGVNVTERWFAQWSRYSRYANQHQAVCACAGRMGDIDAADAVCRAAGNGTIQGDGTPRFSLRAMV